MNYLPVIAGTCLVAVFFVLAVYLGKRFGQALQEFHAYRALGAADEAGGKIGPMFLYVVAVGAILLSIHKIGLWMFSFI